MLKKIVTLGFLNLFFTSSLLAHGMNAPGPNGGNITMPGTFHVELVELKKTSELKIYLLDVAFKNPTTADSSVSVSINAKTELSCAPEKDYFKCKTNGLKAGDQIQVSSTRLKIKGSLATYSYPLKY